MISIVCVYNDQNRLKNALLESLRTQTARFELIALDNTSRAFKSAAQALNHGGSQATGDYIMFIHQDMWLATNTWLEDVERCLPDLPTLGVAGVAGVSRKGRKWHERMKSSIGMFDSGRTSQLGLVQTPEEVQTLDECLLLVPRHVFEALKFDEATFDGWDCYGADYCLSAGDMGLKVYVIRAPSSHCCSRAVHPPWEFKDLLRYQKRLYSKHRRAHRRIYTWMGTISIPDLAIRSAMQWLGPLYMRLCPSVVSFARQELADCDSVLDLGCGHRSLLQVCHVPLTVGVDLFEPFLQESRRTGIHTHYVLADLNTVAFRPKSFDAVIAAEVLEHLTKEEGTILLERMEEWAKKKVIITTPNGFLEQDAYEDNPLQEHQSGWNSEELGKLGYRVRGGAGWKKLRTAKFSPRYQPAFLWERVSDLTQIITYRWPKLAYQLMAVKQVDQPTIKRHK